jgi:nitrate/TMAO reductase-like tetraheme cytochrome c subunit
MSLLKRLWNWCKRHLLITTVLAILSISAFAFVNVQVLHMTSEPEFCAMCHPGQGVGPLAEVDSWEHSGHSQAGVSCLDCHGRPGFVGYMKAKLGGLKDTYMQFTISHEEKMAILSNPSPHLVPAEHCLFCHSDEGNREYREKHKGRMQIVKLRMLDGVVNPEFRLSKGLPDILTDSFVGGSTFDHAMHIEAFDMNCRDCHFGVVHNPMTKTARMNQCVMCHSEYKDSSAPQLADCTSCHQAQHKMGLGKGGINVEGGPSVMAASDVGCTDCHNGVARGVFRPSSSGCLDCHDSSYVEAFNDETANIGVKQEQLRQKRIEVEAVLVHADAKRRDTASSWQLYKKAVYNLKLARNDGTHGLHNPEYAKALLLSVEEDFAQVLKTLDKKW